MQRLHKDNAVTDEDCLIVKQQKLAGPKYNLKVCSERKSMSQKQGINSLDSAAKTVVS